MFLLTLRMSFLQLLQQRYSRFWVVLSSSVVLFMAGVLLNLYYSFTHVATYLKSSQVLISYLSNDVSSEKELELLSAIQKLPNVRSAELIGQEIFVKNLTYAFPHLANNLNTLEEDVVPKYIMVISPNNNSKDLLKKLRNLSGVEEVETYENRYTNLISILNVFEVLTLVLSVGMFISLCCLYVNHFKSSNSFQHQLQQTLLWLGAKPYQIAFPFLLEGAVEGFLGGCLAALALIGCKHFLGQASIGLFQNIGTVPPITPFTNIVFFGVAA